MFDSRKHSCPKLSVSSRTSLTRSTSNSPTAALAEMRDAYAHVQAVPGRTQGVDLRLGPHQARRPALRPDGRLAGLLAEQGWMTVTGAGPGIMQAGMEGAGVAHSIGVSIRLPVRERGQLDHRRRRQARQHEVLLHPQADAHQGVTGLRLPARRVRDARRDVRTADAHPDRQGHAGADRAPQRTRRHVLAVDRHVRARHADRPRARRRPRHLALHDRRLVRGGRRGDRALLLELPLDPVRRQHPRHPDAARSDTVTARRTERDSSVTWPRVAGSRSSSRSASSGATTITSISPGWPSTSPSAASAN